MFVLFVRWAMAERANEQPETTGTGAGEPAPASRTDWSADLRPTRALLLVAALASVTAPACSGDPESRPTGSPATHPDRRRDHGRRGGRRRGGRHPDPCGEPTPGDSRRRACHRPPARPGRPRRGGGPRLRARPVRFAGASRSRRRPRRVPARRPVAGGLRRVARGRRASPARRPRRRPRPVSPTPRSGSTSTAPSKPPRPSVPPSDAATGAGAKVANAGVGSIPGGSNQTPDERRPRRGCWPRSIPGARRPWSPTTPTSATSRSATERSPVQGGQERPDPPLLTP